MNRSMQEQRHVSDMVQTILKKAEMAGVPLKQKPLPGHKGVIIIRDGQPVRQAVLNSGVQNAHPALASLGLTGGPRIGG